MTERLPNVDNLCANPENHKQHICELRLAAKDDIIKKLQENPTFICGNCTNTANKVGALCAPGPLKSNK